ncbi:MAG: hypothetical protein K9I84_16405 [Leadbetterella sp.]|nr:hypothetical protein [Leadbetterella sp.]
MNIKEIRKEDIEKEYGKYGLFNSPLYASLIDKVRYLSGINPFEEYAENKKIIYIRLRPKGLEIQATISDKWGKSVSVCFPFSDIDYFMIEKKEKVFENQSKSVVGRAIIGGVLLGPVGALVGGMSGIGDKKSQDKSMPENILTITLGTIYESKRIFFSVYDKNLKDLDQFLNEHFHDKIKSLDDLIETVEETKKTNSIADEILKINNLLEMGLITKDEFEKLKLNTINNL